MTPFVITVADAGLYLVPREFQTLGLKSWFLFDMEGWRNLSLFPKPFISPFLFPKFRFSENSLNFCFFSPLINLISSNFSFLYMFVLSVGFHLNSLFKVMSKSHCQISLRIQQIDHFLNLLFCKLHQVRILSYIKSFHIFKGLIVGIYLIRQQSGGQLHSIFMYEIVSPFLNLLIDLV